MPKKRRRLLPLVLALPALTSFSSASADQVVLNGGSVLEGVVLERPVTATAEAAARPLRLLTRGGDELRLSGQDVREIIASNDTPAAGKYIRYREATTLADEALEVAVTHFVHPDGGPRVDLVSAVHMADAAYFMAVQRWLDGCDVVLYEGVKGKDQSAADFARTDEAPNPLRALQGKLAGWFGLAYQLEAIDYTRPNFVHADLTAEEMGMTPASSDAKPDEKPDAPGESSEEAAEGEDGSMGRLIRMVKMVEPMLESMMKQGGPQQAMFKKMIAKQLGSADVAGMLGQALPKELSTMLLDRRNAVVIERLKEVRERQGVRDIAVFYGAGHMADLEKTLVEGLGYRRAGGRWIPAWAMGAAPVKPRPAALPKPAATDGAEK